MGGGRQNEGKCCCCSFLFFGGGGEGWGGWVKLDFYIRVAGIHPPPPLNITLRITLTHAHTQKKNLNQTFSTNWCRYSKGGINNVYINCCHRFMCMNLFYECHLEYCCGSQCSSFSSECCPSLIRRDKAAGELFGLDIL